MAEELDGEEFVVDKILDKRVRNGKIEYYLSWKVCYEFYHFPKNVMDTRTLTAFYLQFFDTMPTTNCCQMFTDVVLVQRNLKKILIVQNLY